MICRAAGKMGIISLE
jgi:hypothetical protein